MNLVYKLGSKLNYVMTVLAIGTLYLLQFTSIILFSLILIDYNLISLNSAPLFFVDLPSATPLMSEQMEELKVICLLIDLTIIFSTLHQFNLLPKFTTKE